MNTRLALAGRVALGLAILLLGGASRAWCAFPPDTTGAQLVLTWHAPAGSPRATSSLIRSAKAAGEDTLFICLIPGADSRALTGFTGEIRFRTHPADSLESYWCTRVGNDLTAFRVQLAPDSIEGAASPFISQGFGGTRSDVIEGGARLRYIYAVSDVRAGPVQAGRTYVLAFVRVRRPPAADRAAHQPICAELTSGTVSFEIGYEPGITRGQQRVGLHAPLEQACAEWLREAKPWSPPPRTH